MIPTWRLRFFWIHVLIYLFFLESVSTIRAPDDSGAKFCAAHKGTWVKLEHGKKNYDDCNDLIIWVNTEKEAEAKEACEYLIPFEVVAAKPGFPTKCSFRVYGSCPPAWYQVLGGCYRHALGRYTLEEAKIICMKHDQTAKIVQISGTRIHNLLIKLFPDVARAWIDVAKPYADIVVQRDFRDTDSKWTGYQITVAAALIDQQKIGTIVYKDPKSLASTICSRTLQPSEGYHEFFQRLTNLLKMKTNDLSFKPKEAWPTTFTSTNHYHVDGDFRPYTKTDHFHKTCSNIARAFLEVGAEHASSLVLPGKYAQNLASQTGSYLLLAASPSKSKQCVDTVKSLITKKDDCKRTSSVGPCMGYTDSNYRSVNLAASSLSAYTGCFDGTAVIAQPAGMYTASRHVRGPIPCVIVPIPLQTVNLKCPQGWTAYDRAYELACHLFVLTRKSWDDARAYCLSEHGGTLSAFETEQEKTLLYDQAKGKIRGGGQFYISGKRNPECRTMNYSTDPTHVCYRPNLFSWADMAGRDHTIIDKFWSPGNPDWRRSDEDCLTILVGNHGWLAAGGDNTLNDNSCYFTLPFSCQIMYPHN
ncbi:unnamed protein product [Caenorhabditis auriculariae]|uniref:C-type lectin domain-containing protein n=1 Tax=Caenorhabditis auriculariae TaxID=2777116 RepID=A0A8S1HXX3_9PELO|nr:unnamed protein product [Caenorhabditis auriculariae]